MSGQSGFYPNIGGQIEESPIVSFTLKSEQMEPVLTKNFDIYMENVKEAIENTKMKFYSDLDD